MSLLRGRGRIVSTGGRSVVVARCALCGQEHHYDKGDEGGEEIAAVRGLGYTDEWLPCQSDLPGNFWRIVIAGKNQGNRKTGARPRGAIVS